MALEEAGVQLIAQGSAAYLGDMKAATNATNVFVDATEKGGGRVSAAGQVMIGSFREIGAAAVNLGLAGVQKLADGIFDLAKTGIEMNAASEQAQVAFGTLLGSGEKAKTFLDELQAFAAKTPFEFPELRDNAKKILAMGFAAEDVIPLMTTIGDTVGALGGGSAEIDRVTLAFGQMSAKGKVSAEEMNQLAELGIPAWKLLADSLGLTVAETMALSEKGLIPASEALPALRAGMDQTFGGAMAAQAQTFNGLLSTLKDNASIALQEFTGPIFELAKGGLTELGELVSSPAFADFAEMLGGQVAGAIQDVIGFVTPLISDLQDIIGAFDEAGAMSSEFGEAIGKLASNLGLPGELIQDIVFAAQKLITWFNAAGAESNALDSVLVDLAGTFDNVLSVVEAVADGYMAIANAVLPIITRLWDEHGTEISAFVKSTYDSVIQIVNIALDLYEAIVPPILQAIAGFFRDHGSEIEKILTGAGQIIGSIVTGTMETIKGVFKLALDIIHGDWDAVWIDIKAIGSAQATAIGGIVGGFLDIIAGLFDTSMGEIVDLWENNWNMLVDIATQTDWAQVGQDVVDGILQGLRDAWSSLVSWIVDKMGSLIDVAIDAIDGGSPAMKFTPVGQSIVQGIMLGLTDTWPALTQLVGSISDDLIGDMRDIGEQMQGVIADSFGATASIDRQIAKNLDSLKDVLPGYMQFTTGALKEAQNQANAMLDPAEGAKFFQMRSKQILEIADLQKKLSETSIQEDRNRIQEQISLINDAQINEIAQFDANKAAESPLMNIADQINEIMKAIAGIDLTDEQIRIVDMLSGVWGGLQTPVQSRADAYAHPPMMQYPPPSSGGTSSSSTQNISMPIYTNNSPAAIQQSWAIMQASMV